MSTNELLEPGAESKSELVTARVALLDGMYGITQFDPDAMEPYLPKDLVVWERARLQTLYGRERRRRYAEGLQEWCEPLTKVGVDLRDLEMLRINSEEESRSDPRCKQILDILVSMDIPESEKTDRPETPVHYPDPQWRWDMMSGTNWRSRDVMDIFEYVCLIPTISKHPDYPYTIYQSDNPDRLIADLALATTTETGENATLYPLGSQTEINNGIFGGKYSGMSKETPITEYVNNALAEAIKYGVVDG